MNDELFRLINGLAAKNRFLDAAMIFFSTCIPYLIALCVCTVYLAGAVRRDEARRRCAAGAAVLTAINLALAFVIGRLFYVPRPFVRHTVNLLYLHAPDSSFPSDHATATMSLALGLRRTERVLGNILAALSVLVGFSRIYVGHHTPADILGSFAIVLATGFLYRKFLADRVGALYLALERQVLGRIAAGRK